MIYRELKIIDESMTNYMPNKKRPNKRKFQSLKRGDLFLLPIYGQCMSMDGQK